MRPTGKDDDDCIEYQCGEGAVCDCLAGTEIFSMTTCSTRRYSRLESAVPKSGGVVKCKKVEGKLCVTLDPPAAAVDSCINDSSCLQRLICNSRNVCPTPPAEAGEPCKVNANCASVSSATLRMCAPRLRRQLESHAKVDANSVSGLICNSANVCATPPSAAGEPCQVDANSVSASPATVRTSVPHHYRILAASALPMQHESRVGSAIR
jgi:hypothetical protein